MVKISIISNDFIFRMAITSLLSKLDVMWLDTYPVHGEKMIENCGDPFSAEGVFYLIIDFRVGIQGPSIRKIKNIKDMNKNIRTIIFIDECFYTKASWFKEIAQISDILMSRKMSVTSIRSNVSYFLSSGRSHFMASQRKGDIDCLSSAKIKLSERQHTICDYLMSGKRAKEIAEEMSISQKTVHTHKRKVYQLLGVDNIVELHKLWLMYKCDDGVK